MERIFQLQFVVLGVLLMSGIECHEFMTLNLPSRAPFVFHPSEELSMDLSEIHPVFLYSSSQNDFIHQTLPEHTVVQNQPKLHQHQTNLPRPKFSDSTTSTPQYHRRNKPRNNHSPTYGFHPKPSPSRQPNYQHNQQKRPSSQHKNHQNGRPSFRPRFHEPVYQSITRQENQHQNKHFSENIQVQASVQQNRQHANALSAMNFQNGHTDFNQNFHYRPQNTLPPEKKFVPHTSEHRPHRNNQGYRNTFIPEEHRKPVIRNHNSHNHQIKEEHRQESVRKHVTFEDTSQALKNRNTRNHGNNNFHSKASNGQSSQLRTRNDNERLNLEHDARSMRGENKPQLPPRPPFENGGVKINTLAGELPILQFDSLSAITENPTVFLQNGNIRDHSSTNEEEKKTYLLIKAPTMGTTELPTSDPFVIETLQHASPPYMMTNLAQTSVHIPEVYSSPIQPRTLPQKEETPAIVLDLVQIPDHTTFGRQEEHLVDPIPNAEFRSMIKEDDYMEKFHTTESYPTTPLHSYNDAVHQTKPYFPFAEDTPKYESKAISKPKVKEPKKHTNTSSIQPVSYSSSISVVSVKQNVDSKQQAAKKPKTTLKKSLYHKKKPKIPENGDFDDGNNGSQDVPGDAGVDYPTYKDIPTTSFDCKNIKSPGFYADVEASCQVFHNCDTTMNKHSFMCPNGTIFHQELFICDWWYNVKCDDSPEFYVLNSGSFITDNRNDDFNKKA